MKIKVKFMGALRIPKGKQREDYYEFDSIMTIEKLLDYFKFTKKEKKMLVVLVNKSKKKNAYIIKEHDNIFLTMALGGG